MLERRPAIWVHSNYFIKNFIRFEDGTEIGLGYSIF